MITRDFMVVGGFHNGYVPKLKSAVTQPVFAGANIAVRKEVVAEIGMFDNACITREDADFSLRVAKTRWLIFHDTRAVVRHRFRSNLPGLLRQWFNYGRHHAIVLAKHANPGIELFARTGASHGMMSFPIPFPFRVFVPLNFFNFFHGALAATAAAATLQWNSAAIFFSILSLLMGTLHFLIPLPRRDPCRWLGFLVIRYLLNWAFILGGLIGGLPLGMINIEPAHDRNGLPD